MLGQLGPVKYGTCGSMTTKMTTAYKKPDDFTTPFLTGCMVSKQQKTPSKEQSRQNNKEHKNIDTAKISEFIATVEVVYP